jgi:magnesium transporter
MNEVVNCAAYEDGRKVAHLAVEEVSEVLKVGGQFVWIGLNGRTEAHPPGTEGFSLHDLAVEDALRPSTAEIESTARISSSSCVPPTWPRCWRDAFLRRQVTWSASSGDSLPYAEVRTRCEHTPELLKKRPESSSMPSSTHRRSLLSDRRELKNGRGIGDQRLRAADEPRHHGAIYALKRDLVRIKRARAPLISVHAPRTLRHGVDRERSAAVFRDVHDHAMRINERIDTMREVLSSVLEANLSLMSVNQNEVMKKLASWAAIRAALTLLAGVWGMNFEAMPELNHTPATRGAGAMFSVCGFLFWRFRAPAGFSSSSAAPSASASARRDAGCVGVRVRVAVRVRVGVRVRCGARPGGGARARSRRRRPNRRRFGSGARYGCARPRRRACPGGAARRSGSW